jgi:NAD(P)-dependent dehydrogenase (short-subunit alcohol dehydrogenase family)
MRSTLGDDPQRAEMHTAKRPNVVITGVSTGIGFDAARYLIQRGYRVFGSVRRQDDADRVAAALGPDFTPLLFDVTDEPAIAAAARQVQAELRAEGLHALVNNSGISGPGPLMHSPLADVRRVFDVNVFGLLAVTQAFLPLLGARRDCPHPPGRIVNISSLSGRVVFPFFGTYSASKFAVEALTDALRRELSIYGIAVVAIEPGNVRTPIWDKDEAVDQRFATTDYASQLARVPAAMARMGRTGIPAERVSAVIHAAISASRPKTRYPLAFLWRMSRVLGDRSLDRLTMKAMGLKLRRAPPPPGG